MEEHRYKQLIKALNYKSINKFAKEIELPFSTLNQAITRESGVTIFIAEKILKRFPQVNRDWLLTGQGEMFIDPHTLRDGEPEYKTSQISRLRAKFNAYLASLAMDKSGEDLKKQLRELDDTISDLEKETGAGG